VSGTDEKYSAVANTLRWLVAAALIALLAFIGGVLAAANGMLPAKIVVLGASIVKRAFEELPNHLGSTPVHFLQPSNGSEDGVTINTVAENDLVLLTGFFDGDAGVRLIRRDGAVVAAWRFRHSAHFPDSSFLGGDAPASDWNTDLHGALIKPDGSVVVNYEYGGTVKLDRCGKVLWTLAHPTHHSVVAAADGGYWIPGRRVLARGDETRPYAPLTEAGTFPNFYDDLILKVDKNGQIETGVSVAQVLLDNGLKAILTANGIRFDRGASVNSELVHLNKIAELPASMAGAFPQFAAGDLLISLREHNLIAVIDPNTWRVKWHQIGPWLRQHDPAFSSDGTIRVFNNNTFRTDLGPLDRVLPDALPVSNIIDVDPASGHSRVVYGGRTGQEMLSVIRGSHDDLPDRHILLTEFEKGRAFEVDGDGHVVWEYISRYDDQFVTEITGAMAYPKGYFSVADWSCPAN
jgi:hypothetical protein